MSVTPSQRGRALWSLRPSAIISKSSQEVKSKVEGEDNYTPPKGIPSGPVVPSLNAPANTREGTFFSLVSGVPSRHKQSSEADQKEKGEGRTGLLQWSPSDRPVHLGAFINNLRTGQESAEGIPPDCPTAIELLGQPRTLKTKRAERIKIVQPFVSDRSEFVDLILSNSQNLRAPNFSHLELNQGFVCIS
jgi:hypothetical protein